MAAKKRYIHIEILIILVSMIPVCIIALAFFGLGAYVMNSERVFPNVMVGGIDVSRLTRDEAMMSLDLHTYELRGKSAVASIVFPNGSEFRITGEETLLNHDARLVVDRALSFGRGSGFIMDTVAFILRFNSEYENFEIEYELDAERLHDHVAEFTRNYNDELDNSVAQINDNAIIVVKGAGQVQASEQDVYKLAYYALHESLAEGRSAEAVYVLPESSANRAELIKVRQNILAYPLSATYDRETRMISECVVGVNIDLAGAIALLNRAESGQSVIINMEYTQPEVTREYLENLLFRDLIGKYTSEIPGTEDRLNNVILASEAVNGYVLEPGEEFSFNRVVGQRTAARGYLPGPAISGNTTILAYGGGVCQVSSMIYSAIMDTDVKVIERWPHSLPVEYVPRGRDAAVSWGTLDFRFMNNTDHPIRIDAEVDGRTLNVNIYGTFTHN